MIISVIRKKWFRVSKAWMAHGHDGGAHFAPEHAAVGARHHAGAVDQRLDLRRDVGHVGRRAEQHAVGLDHLLDERIAVVLGLAAAPVLIGRALAAGDTAVNLQSVQLDELGFDALGGELGENVVQQDGGVASLAGASVECDDFHGVS
jgi:hypothetical protein